MTREEWAPSPGDVVRAAVQYSDSEQTKTRFPVIVSSTVFNRCHPDVVVAFATKSINIRKPRDYDVEISERHPAFPATGLAVSTTVRCGRLWSIDKRSIQDVIGVLPSGILTDVHRLVLACFVDK